MQVSNPTSCRARLHARVCGVFAQRRARQLIFHVPPLSHSCVGCDGKGLAAGVRDKLPYGCSYADRRQMPGKRFAVLEHRAVLGLLCMLKI